MLTVDTSEALSLTGWGIVELTNVLLKQGLSYVMLGEFQSDRGKGKFGFYWQYAVVNYFISVDRVLNGLRLQKLKLFKTLLFESITEHVEDSWWKERLAENELMFIDKWFDGVRNLEKIVSHQTMKSTKIVKGTVNF